MAHLALAKFRLVLPLSELGNQLMSQASWAPTNRSRLLLGLGLAVVVGLAFAPAQGPAAEAGTETAQLQLPPMTLADGFRITAGGTAAMNTIIVSGAGDVNGDGLADVMVGYPERKGGVYIIYGKTGQFSHVDLDTLQLAQGFSIRDSASALLSMAGAGDINGDGLADLIVASSSFETWLIFGQHGPRAELDLRQLHLMLAFACMEWEQKGTPETV